MSTRRRILLVFMALSIGCYCQFITSSWRIMAGDAVKVRFRLMAHTYVQILA